MKQTALFLFLFCLWTGTALAQDPVKVDPKHYHVVFENDEVRVLHILYAPGEKSVMHEHPDAVAVFLTDQQATFTDAAGKAEVVNSKAKEARFMKAGKHLPQNTGKGPLEVILVEQKKKPANK